jgi:hypothetical protein
MSKNLVIVESPAKAKTIEGVKRDEFLQPPDTSQYSGREELMERVREEQLGGGGSRSWVYSKRWDA